MKTGVGGCVNLGDILARNARRFGSKPAVISEAGSISYRLLNEHVNCLSNGLLRNGLKKGDRLAALVHNSNEILEIYFCAAKTGAIFCPYNNHLTDKELADVINYSRPRFLFFHRDYMEKLAAAAKNVSSVERYFCLDGDIHPFAVDYRELLSSGEKEEPAIPVMDDDPVSLFFTAGTTGKPKGAIHTHRHVISNGMAGMIEQKVTYDERVLISNPMYHVSCEDNIGRHTFLPNTLVIRREGAFNPDAILRQIARKN